MTGPTGRVAHNRAPAEVIFEQIKDRHDGKIIVLSDYNGVDKPIDARCVCGHQWTSTPYKLRIYGCPKCSKPSKLFTQAEFEAKVAERFGTSLTILSPYQGVSKKVQFRCEAGHEFEKSLASLMLCDNACKYCVQDAQNANKSPIVLFREKVAYYTERNYMVGE